MLVYPVGADTYINQQTDKTFTPWPQNLTGVLVAYAVANPPNGIQTLHNKPFTQKNFDAPKVTGVDFRMPCSNGRSMTLKRKPSF